MGEFLKELLNWQIFVSVFGVLLIYITVLYLIHRHGAINKIPRQPSVQKIPEIVLTGGPCSGKTTGLAYIYEKLRDKGYRVFINPEVATEIISGGVSDIGRLAERDRKKYFEVQRQMVLSMLSRRKEKIALAEIFKGEKCVIIHDRGIMDNSAYMSQDEFNAVLERECLTLHDVRDSYDGVIHLVTAADGAEEFYQLDNNIARQETTLEAARDADARTLRSWIGHPHVKIIDNSTEFESKMKRALAAIARMLGIPVPVEIERKYLLKEIPHLLIPELENAQKIHIEQIYITAPSGQQNRIRRRSQDNSATYYHAQKTDISGIVRHEVEDFISESEYIQFSDRQDPATDTIVKHRYCFVYSNQYFELDVFLEPKRLRGLCLLEIELTEENDKVDLPPFLDIDREVTDEPEFKNYELSKKPV